MNTISNTVSPVALVWKTLNTMTKRRKGFAPERAVAIAKLVSLGVAPGTAATQFHAWKREALKAAA